MVQDAEEYEPSITVRDGAFEVSLEDGNVLFSKLKEGRLPRAEEIIEALEKAM